MSKIQVVIQHLVLLSIGPDSPPPPSSSPHPTLNLAFPNLNRGQDAVALVQVSPAIYAQKSTMIELRQ